MDNCNHDRSGNLYNALMKSTLQNGFILKNAIKNMRAWSDGPWNIYKELSLLKPYEDNHKLFHVIS